MTDLITSTSDPALWNQLVASYNTKAAGWIVSGGTHYEVLQDTSGNLQFRPYSNMELFDDRSFTKSKSASYNELDGD